MRSIIFTSLLLAGPAAADGLGCYAAQGLEDQPVAALSLYVFHNAARQGRYATIQVETRAGAEAEALVPCPTDRACVATCNGGMMAIEQAEDGIEIVTDRFVLGCDGPDLGNGTLLPERYVLARAEGSACGGPG